MTCAEFELLLVQEELTPDARAHFDACADCRALAEELAANAAALLEFRDEVLPSRLATPRAGRHPWRWAAAIAAMLVLAVALFQARAPGPAATPHPVPVPQADLKIKMLTPDPDVVIYWLVDSKGGNNP